MSQLPYDSKTVRYGVFRGSSLVSPQFKQKYKATAWQKENGGAVMRFERDTLKLMERVRGTNMEKMEQSW